MLSNISCNNCGKNGHTFHQCKMPITSYGVIVFRKSETSGFEYLMIRRKDSFGFIDFIRGKYSLTSYEQLLSIFDQMSLEEKTKILNSSFQALWNEMWGIENSSTKSHFKSEESSSFKKFEQLKAGVQVKEHFVSLESLVKDSKTSWEETEWEFPKGRRNTNEKDLDCALREFEEETGICRSSLNIIENVMPFEEIFLGTNNKSYKHKYFLAFFCETREKSCSLALDSFQKSEVSKMEWKKLEDCLHVIRPYNVEKRKLIININNVLQKFKIYS